LRDATLYEKVSRCRDRVTRLRGEVRAAVQAERFDGLRGKIQELLQLTPRDMAMRDLLATLRKGAPAGKPLTNSIGMKLTPIPSGTFLMGSPKDEANRQDNEGPQHEVEITQPFYMGVHTVTQEQYERLMGKNPSWFSSQGGGKDKVKKQDARSYPVEQVSWDDAVAFCCKLSGMLEEKQLGRVYRLPTEAEWEFACRGGVPSTPFHFGNSLSSTQANFNGGRPYGGAAAGPYLERTTAVGSYTANGFGLHDMHGNVWEWCQDWFDVYYYARSPRQDPEGPRAGESRVLRGGSWDDDGWNCRAARRFRYSPGYLGNDIGFRVVLAEAVRTP
jgi:formylglycine-generating enzyme required for sulfatase activity